MHLARITALALCLALTQSACLIKSKSTTSQSGTLVGEETLASIEPGMDRLQVESILGWPTTQSILSDGGEVWKWRHSQVTTKSGRVIFLVSSQDTKTVERTAYVQFDPEGLVTRTWCE